MPDGFWAQAAPWLTRHAPWLLPVIAILIAAAPVVHGASSILEHLREWRRPDSDEGRPEGDTADDRLAQREAELRTRERALYGDLEQQRDDLRTELQHERRAHSHTQRLVVWWQTDSRRGWGKARWAKTQLREVVDFARGLMRIIDEARLPHGPWPDLTLPPLEEAPELPPDEFQEPLRPPR